MLARHANRTFAIALLLSCALHAGLVLIMPNPLGTGTVAATERRVVVPVRITAPLPPPASQPEEPKEEERREVDLGLDAPAPPSRTWLGFTEYVKQLAAKSEVEQAAFTDDPVAASPPPTPPTPQPTPPLPETPAVDPARAEAAARAPESPAPPDAVATAAPDDVANAPQPPPPSEGSPDVTERIANEPAESPTESDSNQPHESQPDPSREATSPEPTPDPETADPIAADTGIATAAAQPSPEADPDVTDAAEAPNEPAPAATFIEALSALTSQALTFAERATLAERTSDDSPQTQPQANNSAVPQPPVESTEPRPVVARRPLTGAPSSGAQSDRESEPSSIIDVPRDQWQLGKPLAAHGLELKPRRPTMPLLTTLTAWPANPVCKISFDRTGVPMYATLLRSTGDDRVDAAIEASLYRWRASGDELLTLRQGETIDITMRLLINPARKREEPESG